jgi:hypothetical protein
MTLSKMNKKKVFMYLIGTIILCAIGFAFYYLGTLFQQISADLEIYKQESIKTAEQIREISEKFHFGPVPPIESNSNSIKDLQEKFRIVKENFECCLRANFQIECDLDFFRSELKEMKDSIEKLRKVAMHEDSKIKNDDKKKKNVKKSKNPNDEKLT